MERKLIEETLWYTIYEYMYNDIPIRIRVWKDYEDGIDLFFDDNFARANGYKNTEDIINSTIGIDKFKEVKQRFGCTPKWVRALEDGGFYFVNTISQPIIGEA